MSVPEIVSIILGILGSIGIFPIFYSIYKFLLNQKIIKFSDEVRYMLTNFYNSEDQKIKDYFAKNYFFTFDSLIDINMCNNFLNVFFLDKTSYPKWYIYKYWRKIYKGMLPIYNFIIRINNDKVSRILEVEGKRFIFIGLAYNSTLLSHQESDLINNKIKSKYKKMRKYFVNQKLPEKFFYVFIETSLSIELADFWWNYFGKYEISNTISDELYEKFIKNSSWNNEFRDLKVSSSELRFSTILMTRNKKKTKTRFKFEKNYLLDCDEKLLNKFNLINNNKI